MSSRLRYALCPVCRREVITVSSGLARAFRKHHPILKTTLTPGGSRMDNNRDDTIWCSGSRRRVDEGMEQGL